MYRGAIILALFSFGLVALATFGLFYSSHQSGYSNPGVQAVIARKTAKFFESDRSFVKAFSQSLPPTGKIAARMPIFKTFVPRPLHPNERSISVQNLPESIHRIPDNKVERLKSLRQSVQILETSASPEFAALSAEMARKTLEIQDLDPESSDEARRILDLAEEILKDFPRNLPQDAQEIHMESVGGQ